MSIKKITEQAARAAEDIRGRAADLLSTLQPSDEPVGQTPAPVQRKVLSVLFNPSVPAEGGRKLWQALNWSDPDALTRGYIDDVREISYGYANYQVVERIEVDRFPVKEDGFAYTSDEFLRCIRAGSGFHQPDMVDYHRILADFDIVGRVNRGEIDEVWLFAFPYAGFYESIMAGPGAFWCNAPPLGQGAGTSPAATAPTRRFVIMGFNYERGVGQMLENLGHRAESIIKHVYRYRTGDDNLWERFSRYDKTHLGQAEVGWMHFAPNSLTDYDWGNRTVVKSRHHLWLNFPNLEGEARDVDCSEWGNGDIRLHHQWWFKHLPHVTGAAAGIAYNWWKYVIDPNTVS